jgi:site-specific DNA-methyltransferase (adenine-specific)
MHIIHNRDAIEVLAEIPSGSIHAIITDPPYSINTKSDGTGKINPWGDLCNAALWYREWIGQCRRVLREDGCLWSFMNWRSLPTFTKASMDLAWPIESLAVWKKEWIGPGGTRGLRPSYELVGLWCMPDFAIKDRGIPDCFSARWSGHKPHGHPAEKPEQAISWILDASALPSGAVVMDPFAGSGTTAAVAVSRGFDFIGCEIDERHWEAACCRMAACLPNKEIAE